MNKLQEIFQAWNIAYDPNKEQAELAGKRIEICNSCDKKVTNLGIHRCSVCGCTLKGKVFSPVKGACPEGKWDEVDKAEIQNKVMIDKIKNKSIFVQIASYRDPELLKTLDDLFDKADRPDDLTVCVAWQHNPKDAWDNLDKYKNDPRVIILDIPYKQSKGACWARNRIQQFYNNQAYTLQLDSHHRFIKGWDTELIEMHQGLKEDGYKKPLLTGYISSFDPDNDPKGRNQEPWWMTFDRFTPEGVVFFLPASIPDIKNVKAPVRARFFSAHFTFTSGDFCTNVPHDPNFYFHGEEITLAVRAFTHGYDLFHPHKVIAWHEYTRKGRTKHWDDSGEWVSMNTKTHKKTRQLLGIDGEANEEVQKSMYGLGNVRTLQDYEKYAGIRFRDRAVQQYTLDNKYPPNPEVEDYDNSFFSKFKHCIDIHEDSLPEEDYEVWVVAFLDKDGKDIFRKDCDKNEIASLRKAAKNKDGWINIWREYTGQFPHKWLIWPYSTSKGWCDRIERELK